ncbi:hypothetical protein OH77DRAFT_1297679 [Trametes cingulata]|nr:hypothetical protein OH77DRAFT_1297679 [Trametes cingulata]
MEHQLRLSFHRSWHTFNQQLSSPHTLRRIRCTYGIRRSEFLESTGIMGHILKFTHLEQFTLSIMESDPAYDVAWWTAHISEKLPKLRCAVQVVLDWDYSDFPWDDLLWVPIGDHAHVTIHPQEQNESTKENRGDAQGHAGPLFINHST